MIYIGIKYVLSGANERANLKGTFPKYLIGVAFIVLCSTISSAVANIANTDGSNTPEGIVDKGFALAGITIGGGNYSGTPSTNKGNSNYHPTSEAPSYNDTMMNLKDYSDVYSGAVTTKNTYDDKGRISEVIYYDANRQVVGKDEYKYFKGVFESAERVKEIKHVSNDGKEISKEKFDYSDNDGISSTNITTEKNGTKQNLVTVNYRTKENTVASIIKYDIIDNSFFVKPDEYIITDMQTYDDALYEKVMKN